MAGKDETTGGQGDAPPAGAKTGAEPSADEVAAAAAKLIDKRDAATNPQPGPGVQAAMDAARAAPKTAAGMASQEPTTMMVVPRRVLLTLDDHSRVQFEAGTQQVPNSLANWKKTGKPHPYLTRNGATIYDPNAKPKPAPKAKAK